MSKSMRLFWVLVLGAALGACASFRPPAGAPEPAAPASFTAGGAGLDRQSDVASADAAWWTRFGDPVLDELVTRALAGNRDLAESLARLEAARAARGLAGWGFAPEGGVAAARVEKQSAAVEAPGAPLRARRSGLYRAGIDASWEIDLFGRVRSAARAADGRLEGALALHDQARLLVVAETIATYFEARGAADRIAWLERTLADQRERVELQRALVEEEGLAADALDRALAEAAADAALLAGARERLGRLEVAVAVLVGERPGVFRLPAAARLGELRVEPVAIGDPAALLARRPDVAAAAAELAAQQAEIGVATAELFPQIRVAGFLGFLAGGAGDLGGSASRSWLVAPTISWGILDLGRVRARIAIERAESRAALAAWERTVLRALEEAENAFRGYATAQETLAHRLDQARHASAAATAAQARFEEGLVPYLDALIARRDAQAAELARIDALAAQRTALVAVFRALGSVPTEGARNGSSAVPAAEAPRG